MHRNSSYKFLFYLTGWIFKVLCSSHFENITANCLSLYQILMILFSLVVRVRPPSWSSNYLKSCLVFFLILNCEKSVIACFHHHRLFHSIFHFCQISDGNIVRLRYKPCPLPRDTDFSYLVYWEPCRRCCIWGARDLDQAMSALLGLVPRGQEAHM